MSPDRARPRGQSVAQLIAAAGVLACLVPSGASGGTFDDDAEQTERILDAAAMLSAEYDIGDTLVVKATVTADQLVEGRIEVRGGGSSYQSQVDISVAGGSSKQFLLLVPTSQFGDGRVTIELVEGSRSVDTDTVTFSHSVTTDVAGVMPTLSSRIADIPPRVTLAGDTKRVNMVQLPVAVLDEGAPALSQLDSIAATSDDLSQLSPTGLQTLLAWLSRGGQLVLDDSDDLSALPESWRPGTAGFARADRGIVIVADGMLSSSKWADAVPPAPLSGMDNQFGFFGMDVVIDPRITLSQRAGVVLPNLTKIVLALGAYVVVVGPIMYLILRKMRRLTAAWIAIPLASMLVAGAVIITGSSWRTSGRPTGSAIVELSEGGGYAYNDALMFRRSAGRSSLALPAGWSAAEQNMGWFFGGPQQQESLRNFVNGGTDRRIDVDLENGQIAVLGAEGAVSEAALKITSVSDADANSVEGTVTNTTPWKLQSVAAFAPGAAVLIGDLEPGESKPYVLKGVKAASGESRVGEVWPNPQFGMGFKEPAPGVDYGIWSSYSARQMAGIYPIGYVRIAGWTTERPSDITSSSTIETTTLITALSQIEPGEGNPVRPFEIPVNFVEPPWDPNTGQPGEPVARFDLPASASGQTLQLKARSNAINKVELLGTDGKWVAAKPVGEAADVFAVPPAAIRGGSLLVRFGFDQNFGFDTSVTMFELSGVAQ